MTGKAGSGDAKIRIRLATPADAQAIAALTDAAFSRPDERLIVGRLRADGLVAAELVADNGAIVGHLLLSWLRVAVDGRDVPALALAPMAVCPAWQHQGIGSQLVRAASNAGRDVGAAAIIVLGQPAFYGRLGYDAAPLAHLAAPFSGPALMAAELKPGALAGRTGSVVYPAAFGLNCG